MPVKDELQKSRRDVTIELTWQDVALSDRYGRIQPIRLKDRNDERQTALMMWLDMDSVWSNLTPRYLTDSCILISEFKIVMELPATSFTREAVPTIITSLLSVFSINLLLSTQHKMSLIHFWIAILVNSNFSGDPLWNTMSSSAYLGSVHKYLGGRLGKMEGAKNVLSYRKWGTKKFSVVKGGSKS